MKQAYLDNAATTMVCSSALEAACRAMTTDYGNPSSLHSLGFTAEQKMTDARAAVAGLIGARTVTFTSGGTEANNLAVFGGAAAQARWGRHVVTTAMEHASVANAIDELERQGYSVTRLLPDEQGNISPAQVENACREDTVLVAAMLVNNETGALFDIEKAVPRIRQKSPHAHIHTDAVQAAGKLAIQAEKWGVDTLSLSAHKLHGCKGSGALYVRTGAKLSPYLFGGGQEKGLRPGTEATPSIAAFGAAVRALPPLKEQMAHFSALRDCLLTGLRARGDISLHLPAQGVPYLVNFAVRGLRSETMLHFLAGNGVFVSSGSACAKGKGSRTLSALGIPPEEADSTLRVSFCRDNTCEDICLLLTLLQEASVSLARKTR